MRSTTTIPVIFSHAEGGDVIVSVAPLPGAVPGEVRGALWREQKLRNFVLTERAADTWGIG